MNQGEKNKEDLSKEVNIHHIRPPFIFSSLMLLVFLGHAGPAGCILSFKLTYWQSSDDNLQESISCRSQMLTDIDEYQMMSGNSPLIL